MGCDSRCVLFRSCQCGAHPPVEYELVDGSGQRVCSVQVLTAWRPSQGINEIKFSSLPASPLFGTKLCRAFYPVHNYAIPPGWEVALIECTAEPAPSTRVHFGVNVDWSNGDAASSETMTISEAFALLRVRE